MTQRPQRGVSLTVVCLFGLPDKIVSDRGPAFASQLWRDVWTALGVKLNISSARHPETDGQTEVTNKTVVTWLRHFVDMQSHDKWSQLLGLCEFSLNSAKATEMGMSAFECDLGRQPRAPQDVTVPQQAAVGSAEFLEQMEATLHQAQDAIALNQERQAANADAHRRLEEFEVGDMVLLSAQGVRDQNAAVRESNKLGELFHGPYRVKEKRSAVVYELELPKEMQCHPVFHISKLRKYIHGAQTAPRQGESVQQPTKDPTLFEVEKVLKERKMRGREEVLVKWKGWGDEHNSWVAKANYDKASKDLERSINKTTVGPKRQVSATPAVEPAPVPRVVTTTRSGRVVRSYAQVAGGGRK